jgi:hypothetical protein
MRDKNITRKFFINKLWVKVFGNTDFDGYLMMEKTKFKFTSLNLKSLTQKRTMDKFILGPTTLTVFTNHY